MKKIYLLTVFIFLCLSAFSPLFAGQGEVDFNIRFFDRRVYYVANDPILVQVTITNNSPKPYRFKFADRERAFSVNFDIRDMRNSPVTQADFYYSKRNDYNQIFYREITIEVGESFSFVEDLRNYVKFEKTGSYRVRAKIYPELNISSSSEAEETNYLNLTLRPSPVIGSDGIPVEMDIATGAVLVRQKLSPDQVVSYMIEARQKSQWDRFFLYLDLETMLTRDSYEKRRYQAESEEGRRRMVLDYRKKLEQTQVDGDISVVPTSFEIERTEYGGEFGKVVALLRFKYQNHTELKRYTYDLEKKDDFWVIVNYSVQLRGYE